ncbi:ATP-binding protein [Aeromonas cavernicola]|uniref:Sensory/regulatory protein RpfC n=1 Tax=Aeromonas cavernicola TaxID=1006623 RepID=A0A2H9U9S0_9GAMM|nr:ATP-binding protein [Aeromonas cavernicola]PJG60773.1 hybrid sensor histidine kinase/response regulator [Aeromonas cavernicola]
MRPMAASQRFLFVVLSVLLFAFAGIGTIQYRQLDDLQRSSSQGEDNIMWNYFQLYNEALRFQNALQTEAQHKLQLRYDIMVSRMTLALESKDRTLLQQTDIYPRANKAIRYFINQADIWLGPKVTKPLSPPVFRQLRSQLEQLLPVLHQLTLEVNQQVTLFDVARREGVREQIITTIMIATLQFALLFALALLIWKQMNVSFLQHKLMQQLNEKLTKANRAAEAGTRAKSSFLANMSHEIRTPMNGILGMLSLLAEREMDSRERDYIETARESANHLLGLLNDILDISKLEEGKVSLLLAPHHLPRLIEDIRALMQSSCDKKGITLSLTIAPSTPEWIVMDILRVRQILFNLLSNAIKFTHQGDVSLTIDANELSPQSHSIRVAITDTGIGMSQAQVDKLFQRFFQADASINRQYGGSGLGLEISRNLARLMGGDISVSSHEGEGSCFTFIWPAQATIPSIMPLPAIASAHRPSHILVVDDNATNRKVISAMLATVGHRVTVAVQGQEALAILADTTIDIVLMDVQMPVMDGLAATRYIRESKQPWARIPIIALTADAMPESRHYYLSHGMDGYITKPINKTALLAEINKQMALSEQDQQFTAIK